MPNRHVRASHRSGGWTLRPRCRPGQARTPSGLQSSCLQTGEGQEGRVPLEDLLLGTDPIHVGPMRSRPNHLPEAPPPHTISLGVKISTHEFGGVWEGNGTPLQCSCLENPMDGGAWKAAVHGVAEGRTRLSDFTFTFYLWCSD